MKNPSICFMCLPASSLLYIMTCYNHLAMLRSSCCGIITSSHGAMMGSCYDAMMGSCYDAMMTWYHKLIQYDAGLTFERFTYEILTFWFWNVDLMIVLWYSVNMTSLYDENMLFVCLYYVILTCSFWNAVIVQYVLRSLFFIDFVAESETLDFSTQDFLSMARTVCIFTAICLLF